MKATQFNSDLLVLGAGPGGCAAAIRGRQLGLSVALVDPSSRPRRSPGETLHPGVEALFRQLDVWNEVLSLRLHRHAGVWVEGEGHRRFQPYGEDDSGRWHGFQVDRRELQRILRHRAIALGTHAVLGSVPDKLLMNDGRVEGVCMGQSQYRARWTIDATGRTGWMAERLALTVETISSPLRMQFGWRRADSAETEPVFTKRIDGWNWRAPLGGGRIAWVELRLSPPGDSKPKGIDATWKFRRECAGTGYFLVGDSAGTTDPSASHGVLRALMSGALCSHLSSGCARAVITEEGAADQYRNWYAEQMAQDSVVLERYSEGRSLLQ